MAEISDVTLEELLVLYQHLFTNMNNMDRNYYDMFFNEMPMDIELERYDDKGILQIYKIPNLSKAKQNVVKLGNGTPDGSDGVTTPVAGALGTFYLDENTHSIWYKFGSGNRDWYMLFTMSILIDGALPVHYGGLGVTSITGIMKGNGDDPVSSAIDGEDFMSPASTSNMIDNKIISHNEDATSHETAIDAKIQAHNDTTENHSDIRSDISDLQHIATTYVRFPNYRDCRTTIEVGGVTTELENDVDYVATEDGWLLAERYADSKYTSPAIITIDGTALSHQNVGVQGNWNTFLNIRGYFFPIRQGSTFRFSGANTRMFIPMVDD